MDGFHERLEGKNGGGDPYRTDGRLAVGILTALGASAGTGFPLDLKARLLALGSGAAPAAPEAKGDFPEDRPAAP